MTADEQSNTDSSDEDRKDMVELMALVDEIDHRLNAIGGDQRMSVGPVLSQIRELRQEITERGKNYGMIGESVSEMDLRADASNLDVKITEENNED